ncbi:haloacid dehalogenase [Corynebacterium stationis]|nr:haloacid dehalogenase [Corynebacterium stationis]AQX72513.1 haloacid dehalogenase [Corynebacterium stationis]ASJ20063.1 haloacid dehalogenase [Corynebacterium stationis]
MHDYHLPSAVLFDRDNTLVVDVPYNGDPALVRPMPGARDALDMLRAHGIPVGVISNQSGIGRGLITNSQVQSVNQRITEILGHFDIWKICPHLDSDGCACRKPEPGMLLSAAQHLGVDPQKMVFVGDIGADIGAARAAGCRGILVPTEVTLQSEVDDAPIVASDLTSAVEVALGVH